MGQKEQKPSHQDLEGKKGRKQKSYSQTKAEVGIDGEMSERVKGKTRTDKRALVLLPSKGPSNRFHDHGFSVLRPLFAVGSKEGDAKVNIIVLQGKAKVCQVVSRFSTHFSENDDPQG